MTRRNFDNGILDFVGLVQSHGYPAEEHYLRTEDGYKLIIHRIPGSPKSPKIIGKPVVLLLHGLFGSSDSWAIMGPNKDLAFLAFILADSGYDVWLGNARGNSYCRSHSSLSTLDKAFWDFSFHEIGYYDLPAMIDYTLGMTDQNALTYIGHSMGTTISYVLLSTRPKYNKKIKLAISLAPVAIWNVRPNDFVYRIIRGNARFLKRFFYINGIRDLFPQTDYNWRMIQGLCNSCEFAHIICKSLIFSFAGADPEQFNTTLLPHMSHYFPAGASVKTLLHYSQNIENGEFRQYDYSFTRILKIFLRSEPPLYKLNQITAPFVLMYSENDPLVHPLNVFELSKQLGNVIELYKVPHSKFNHLDYIWAREAKIYVYDKITELLPKVRNPNAARGFGEPVILDFIGLVKSKGYDAEEHYLTTEDGYKLVIHRISGSQKFPPSKGKPIVLLQHGFLGSSDFWVLAEGQNNLAFMMADNGYDVWIGNVRGNSYCRSHEKLSTLDPKFWKFSFHEFGIYDMPAIIDYSLSVTGEKSIFYIGHSMGTTISYVLLSTKPDYNEKIKFAISLAPIAYWKANPSLSWQFDFFDENNIYDILPLTDNFVRMATGFCSGSIFSRSLCVTALSIFAGSNPEQFNVTLLPSILSHFPAGTAVQTMDHYKQNFEKGTFRQFDHCLGKNWKLCGKKQPMEYNMKEITAPFALIYSVNDALTIEENVMVLAKKLPNVVELYKIADNKFNHADYVWHKKTKTLLNDKIMELLSKYR
ncbi:hypothetical protein PV326_012887 [Microctonus aethiopoides]|nr:hypothetical protein PV326_012887 [Microctonus aethiopoides]